MQKMQESKEICCHPSKGDDIYTAAEMQHEMQAFLSFAFNIFAALHTLLNRQAREADKSSPRGDKIKFYFMMIQVIFLRLLTGGVTPVSQE